MSPGEDADKVGRISYAPGEIGVADLASIGPGQGWAGCFALP